MGPEFLMPSLRRIILASASPARKRLLHASGITAEVVVSGVNEEDPALNDLSPSELVIALAIMKAHTVRGKIDVSNALIIGCDSTFEYEGKSIGKPGNVDNSIALMRKLGGQYGFLHTGQCVIDMVSGREFSDISTSNVTFADLSDGEISAYANSGEPLNVAGGFTLDGLAAPFIERIEGDPTGIIGLSLPLLRKAVRSLGLEWTDVAEMVVRP
jgi:septum formation protein